MLRSESECLNHIKCFSSSLRSLEGALLCNVAGNEVSFKQLPLLSDLDILIAGRQHSDGKFINANFPPPVLQIDTGMHKIQEKEGGELSSIE